MSEVQVLRIITIVGARPQFIKAAAVSTIARASSGVSEQILHTGQHYDDNMSESFFKDLGIPRPDFELRIGSATHGAQTGRMLEAIESILVDERPDWVLVYGDTNSTLAGALAAAKLNIPLAHVEAGLRSFNRRMPEEINRVLTDHASDLLFTPTAIATRRLLTEGIEAAKVVQAGDVMYDAALRFGALANTRSSVLRRYGLEPNAFTLVTVHRAENTDSELRLRAIVEGLVELSRESTVVLPLHPRTRKALGTHDLLALVESELTVLPPVGYLDMLMLEQHARVVVTDSGGVQKEAFFQGVPCVTLRDETEWSELVELGWNRLVSPTSGRVVAEALRQPFVAAARDGELFGAGDASQKIVDALLDRAA